ncbi:MAG: energy-coupling factor transporter ATPase [Oscillospiraceae bacterium]|nr:energy-coupling factor transporter ATPase [Oscillospiraceae bacterium]
MAEILKIDRLTHTYSIGTPFEHTALKDISLSIEQGEIIGLIGHTGCGKSTLIQHMNGLLKPTSGHVYLDGKDIWSSPKITRASRFRVGLVFQYPEHQLFEETVYKDISFGPRNMGLSQDEIHSRILEAIQFVGLTEEDLQKSPFDLSGGQKRRVAIAGVIAMQPDVLILDEPTAGLDPAGRDNILENIRAYHKARNSTIVLVSHSMEDMAQMADRLIVMKEGRLFMQGPPGRVFARAEDLTSIGLTVPQVTTVIGYLRELGLPLPANLYTTEQAADAILSLWKGGHHA